MKFLATNKRDQNEAWVDPWSVVHGATGLAFGLTEIAFWKSLAAAIAFDVFENIFEKTKVGQRFFNTSGPESWGNVIADLILFSGGWWLGRQYNKTGPAKNPKIGRMPRKRVRKRPRGNSRDRNPSSVQAPRGARQRIGESHVSMRNDARGTIEVSPR